MSKKSYGLSTKKSRNKKWWLLAIMLIWVIVCMSYCTQSIARIYGYDSWFGQPVYDGWYWPWQCVSWYLELDKKPALTKVITNAQLLFILPLGLVLLIVLYFGRRAKGRDDIHGTAQWATKKDIKQAGLFATEGVYVGGWLEKSWFGLKKMRYLMHNGPENILAFAPPRSGKGVGLVIPTLFSWPESAIILDIKGENFEHTAGRRKKLGHKILRFEPTDSTGTASRFNPLAEIRLNSLDAVGDAQRIAEILADSGLKDDGSNKYFRDAASTFATGAILHTLVLCSSQGKVANLADLLHTMTDENLVNGIKDLFTNMLETEHAKLLQATFKAMPEDEAKAIERTIKSSAVESSSKGDRELGSVFGSIANTLNKLQSPIIAANTSASDFTIDDLVNYEKPVSLYLVLRPSDLDITRPLIRIMLNQILRRLTETLEPNKHRLLLMLDEFAQLGKMDILKESLAFMTGYGIKAYLILQDLTQLHEVYGKEESITSNCHIRIAYAPNKVETAKLLSDMVGKTTVVEKKRSLSGGRMGYMNKTSESITQVGRPLLTPDECMRLPAPLKSGKDIKEPGDMLILPAGSNPIYGRQILYFLDPTFSKWAEIQAPRELDILTGKGQETSVNKAITKIYKEQLRELEELDDEGN